MVLLVTLGAMAQAEATVTLVHTASSYSGATAGAFTSTVDAAKEHINLSKFSGTWAGAAYAEFSIEMPEGNYSIKSASLAWSAVGPNKKTGYTTDVMYVTAGSYLNYEEMALGSAKVDLGATYIATVSIAPWAAVTDFTTDVSGAVKEIVESGQNYIIFKFTNNPGGGDLYGKGATEKNPVLTIELADANSMTTYTVKYVDESGAEIKEASVYDILTGENASISDENKVAIYKEDKKYIYVSCDKESITTVADGASNVITATFREAATWNYTVNAVDGDDNVLKVLATGSNFEGETVTIPYNQYILKDSALYAAFANSQQYNKFITLSADDMVVPVVYNADTIDNVIYFSEAENIEGMTATTSGNANIRCSNGTGAYNGSDDPVVVTTLNPGVYTITAQIWGNKGVNFNIVCGDSTLVVSTMGYILSGSKEFTVNEPTEVTIPKAGDSGKCIDWIYIQEKDPTLTTYTVKYVDEAGNELKEASVYDILPGDTASIKAENKEIIIVGDKRYGYDKCDHDTIVAVPSADMNVITATFRELVKYSYTVNAVDKANNKLKVVADTSDFEGTTVTVPYNQYILVDDVLYAAPAIDKEYNKYITLASDTIVPIVYEASSIDRVVYFSEAENIEGMTATTSGNANIRCSNGTGAYNGSDDPVVVTTLTPGIYTIAAQVWGNAGVHFNIVCGGDTLVVSTTGSITTGSKEFVVNEESQVTILRAGDRNKSIDWIYIQEKDPALTTYTVKYVDEADNELKEASVYDILPGEKAFIKDENMVAILKGDKKYAYKSCDKDTIVAVPSAELNVITATFRELAKYSYTVDAVDEAGNELKVIADTSDFEGTVTVPYNQYILVDDVLYVASADNQQYNKYVTLASDTAMSIVYKESSIDNIVYFSEAEDIEGMTATTSGYANVRCSDGTGAYNASDDPVVVTTLAPGAYTIAAQVWGNAGVHFNIVCGGDTLVVSTTGSITKGSKEFVVNEESQVEILKAGDRNKSIDWIYIQNRELIIADNGSDLNAVGPYSSVSYTRDIAADTYATICLPFAPDAASLENYSFYTLESVDEGILNFVEETAPVANTPYIYCLKEGKTATAITGGITVVSNELNDVVVGDWTMKGSFTNQSFDTSAADVKYYGYVSGENIVVKSDDTFAVEPYRAYFTSSVDVADMYLRIISSDDEATEITTADLDVQKPVVIYDLAGRRVEKMDKGIYIVNGKKVVK